MVFARGDLPSVKAVSTTLDAFAHVFGLWANTEKIDVYLGGIAHVTADQILGATGFTRGSFPFRYLGIPLNSSRLASNIFSGGEELAWNKPLLVRWIWGLVMNKHDLWSSWLSSYVLKRQAIWTVSGKQSDSDIFARVGAVDYATTLVRSWARGDCFATSLVYYFLRDVQPRFYGIVMINHYVWHHVLVWMGFKRRAWALSREFDWIMKHVRRRHWRTQWMQVAFTSSIHNIWLERNYRIFLDREMDRDSLISRIKFHVSVRVLNNVRGV
ncbi:hypothetical protein RND81_09G045200 [Saponaria officinalis]|uniref:Reverse transcriptase zinc-binding domain-containing protein n=1 Tax=Saponaria officinalis TaxID=3572 RepID=A0AAW1IIG7_SAPOF